VSWRVKRDAIRQAVAMAAEVSPGTVVWHTEARPAADPLVICDIVAVSVEHDSREARVFNGADNRLDRTRSSVLRFTVSCRVESIQPDAVFKIEDIRAGLVLDAQREFLREHSIAYIGQLGAVRGVTITSQQRAVSSMLADFEFRGEFSRAETQIPFVETVSGSINGETEFAGAV